jgi:hypothetical protein
MYTHPETFIWLQEQDREHEMTKRALERAARSGGEQRPGLARGGISSFARFLLVIASAAENIRFGGPRSSSDQTGLQGA